jgi:carboxyl-terminal processing protease
MLEGAGVQESTRCSKDHLLEATVEVATPSEGKHGPSLPVEVARENVFPTGNESSLIDSILGEGEEIPAGRFSNSLDHAFAVLVAKADPRPEPATLIRNTVLMLKEEYECQASANGPLQDVESTVVKVLEQGSFVELLGELGKTVPADFDLSELVEVGLKGMVGEPGRGSFVYLLPPSQGEAMLAMIQNRESGKEPGLLGIRADNWPSIDPVPGTPAALAGIEPGDVILSVAGQDVSHITSKGEGVDLLRGRAGEKVTLVVRRGDQKLSFEIRRAGAADEVQHQRIADGTIYMKIPTFEGSGIGKRCKDILTEEVRNRASVFILDLRDNGGGRPEEANAVADLFLDSKILQFYEFVNREPIAIKSNPGELDANVIVLVNRNTHSSAEMLAMALRENDRALLIGEPTAGSLFGKDMVKLQTGHVLIFRCGVTILSPMGKDYTHSGLTPDISIGDEKSSAGDVVLDRAVNLAHTLLQRNGKP